MLVLVSAILFAKVLLLVLVIVFTSIVNIPEFHLCQFVAVTLAASCVWGQM